MECNITSIVCTDNQKFHLVFCLTTVSRIVKIFIEILYLPYVKTFVKNGTNNYNCQ
jgi:hypothetical protein